MKFFVRDLFCRPRIYLERTGNWRELPQYTLSLVWNWILGKCLPNTSTIRNIQATEFSNNKPSLSFTCQQNPAGTLAAQLISLLSVTSRNVQDLVIPLKMFAVISILLQVSCFVAFPYISSVSFSHFTCPARPCLCKVAGDVQASCSTLLTVIIKILLPVALRYHSLITQT